MPRHGSRLVPLMITASQLEVRVGARLLMENVSFRVANGDKVGLVGRNGAGKTTLTKILAGDGRPAAGTITRSGELGYLPQDPRTGDPEVLARDRILSARGLDDVVRRLRQAEKRDGLATTRRSRRRRCAATRAPTTRCTPAAGTPPSPRRPRSPRSLGLETRILDQPLKTLSGGQRRRVELARILFSDADILLLDEPTNHLDADSIVWLRDFLKSYNGGSS